MKVEDKNNKDTDNCPLCEELRRYTKDIEIKCSKCSQFLNVESYQREETEMEKWMKIFRVPRGFNYPKDYFIHNDQPGTLTEMLLGKIENAVKEKIKLDFDIFISCKLIRDICTSHEYFNQYCIVSLCSRKKLKDLYSVSDEMIEKLSKIIGTINGRKVYVLFRGANDNDNGHKFIGNTIAKYYKYITIMNIVSTDKK